MPLKPFINKTHCADNYYLLKQMPPDSVDLICADPQYGYGFMNKHWDKELPSVETLAECRRVLKPGAFGFFMASPRQDVLSQMMMNLRLAGFNISFSSIYWTYATGFPKAMNMSKAIDKKLGKEREVVGKRKHPTLKDEEVIVNQTKTAVHNGDAKWTAEWDITASASAEAQQFEGAYGGFQPKPAVEIIIVAMKPMNQKTFIEQALHNGKGVTWLGNCQIPYTDNTDKESARFGQQANLKGGRYIADDRGVLATDVLSSEHGRFPANMLVSDDVLNDGKDHPTSAMQGSFRNSGFGGSEHVFGANAKGVAIISGAIGDSGSYSRYFDLDAWFEQCAKHIPNATWETFPFLVVPKPATSEKDMGLHQPPKESITEHAPRVQNKNKRKNFHPTVKPITLMSYLIALGSREGDTVLDPWAGSGTTLISAKMLMRNYIGIDNDAGHIELANARLKAVRVQLKMF